MHTHAAIAVLSCSSHGGCSGLTSQLVRTLQSPRLPRDLPSRLACLLAIACDGVT